MPHRDSRPALPRTHPPEAPQGGLEAAWGDFQGVFLQKEDWGPFSNYAGTEPHPLPAHLYSPFLILNSDFLKSYNWNVVRGL